jgi:hypothetical protein
MSSPLHDTPSFAGIADELTDAEHLLDATYMAASYVEDEVHKDSLKRLAEVTQDKLRHAREFFEITYGNPIYREQREEKRRAKAEAAKSSSPPKESAVAPPKPGADPITRSELMEIYDTLTLTQGLFDAATTIAEHHIPLDQRGAMDMMIYAIEEKVSEAEKKVQQLIERLEGRPFIGR